ncbi:alkaline phosphatase (plasmid) [Bacillus sp. 31A1R]|uniref:Alkaline phosphatase n=1 Tax=Robertmurraya mangrovi TaxID=3098077 RepID=A0ABU5IV71_9BACI|nr:alkaline phosphatase [Bacillus sp. 31A1R]MDZ5471044.1 alkaline phosphatase [Bacillus sp. 31A1R]
MKKKIYFLLLLITFSVFNPKPVVKGETNQHNRPKNVILMIGDGMGLGQMEIARMFEYGREGKLFIETLPHVGLVHTYSANNVVTDSAAGGTALATGVKTNNGMIGMSPDKKEVDSILDKFKANGKKVGVISTNTVTDATPASFTASVQNRWDGQYEIAKQQLKLNVDVLLGGGSQFFQKRDERGASLIDEFKNKGYSYVTNRTELSKAKGEKLLGLFNSSYMSFKLDQEVLKSNEPSLTEMTQKGIEFLSKGETGFFLIVEGARIDHAAHSSDITGIWKETIEFDQAVKGAVNWANTRNDTLVIVVADHETMGISLTEPIALNELKNIKVSPAYMASKLIRKKTKDGYTEKSIKDVFKTYAHIELSNEEVKKFNESIENSKDQVYKKFKVSWEIGNLISEHYQAGIVRNEVRSISKTGGHTGNMIPIFAFGKGAEVFDGVMDNTDVPKRIENLMGYEFLEE